MTELAPYLDLRTYIMGYGSIVIDSLLKDFLEMVESNPKLNCQVTIPSWDVSYDPKLPGMATIHPGLIVPLRGVN